MKLQKLICGETTYKNHKSTKDVITFIIDEKIENFVTSLNYQLKNFAEAKCGEKLKDDVDFVLLLFYQKYMQTY